MFLSEPSYANRGLGPYRGSRKATVRNGSQGIGASIADRGCGLVFAIDVTMPMPNPMA
jgi:hypothetical protein